MVTSTGHAPNLVEVRTCDSWEEFTQDVRARRYVATRVFRGHQDAAWKLASKLERQLDRMRGGDSARSSRKHFSEGSFESMRDHYLQRFKDFSVGLPGFRSAGLTDDDWWAIGRHHGLVTPLLDWSESPYVASYFAFIDRFQFANPGTFEGTLGAMMAGAGPIAVWELCRTEAVDRLPDLRFLTERGDGAYRQRAQCGLFSYLDHDVHLDLEAYLTSHGLAHLLTRFEIAAEVLWEALPALHQMNINLSTLFLDLDGAASMANVYHHWPLFEGRSIRDR